MYTSNRAPYIVLAVAAGLFLVWLVTRIGGGAGSAETLDLDTLNHMRESTQQQESLALARSMYLDLLERGARAQASLEELHTLHSQWENEISQLLHNEDGRYIAADAGDVEIFRAHFTTLETVRPEVLDAFDDSLDALLAPVRATLDANAVSGAPSADLSNQLDTLTETIQERLAPYQRAMPAIQAMTAAARNRGTRAASTLQEELDQLVRAEAQTRAARIEAARRQTEDEATAMLAQAAQALLRAEAERERMEIGSEEERVKAQAALDALEAKATNPATLRRLEPFIKKTTTVFTATAPRRGRWREGATEAQPLSLGAISRYGALEPTEDGARLLHGIATDFRNDRPPWIEASTPEDWEEVRETQALLRELGPTLVSLGHLRP